MDIDCAEPTGPGGVRISLLAGLTLFGALVALAWWLQRQSPSPPALPVLGEITGFTLTNQAGAPFASHELAGRLWVADIIFTRCPGPCPQMTAHLAELQRGLDNDQEIHFVTLTADPDYDSPDVLTAYAARFGADTNRWHFLTGPRVETYRVATGQLRLAVAENPDPESAAPEDLFIHSTKLVLVDAQGRLRGFFDGQSSAVVEELRRAIEALEQEPPLRPR